MSYDERDAAYRAIGYRKASIRGRSISGYCLRVLARKRCLGHECACRNYRRILDHVSVWRTPKGHRVMIAEPYGASGTDLAELIKTAHTLGIAVQCDGESPYYPGRTFRIVLTEPTAQSEKEIGDDIGAESRRWLLKEILREHPPTAQTS